MDASTVVIATLVLYKALLITIGLVVSSRNRTTTDFFLGGRALGPLVAGLSYAASTSSAWVLLGFSGFVYAVGLSALWMVPGIWAGYAVVWLVFGERLRRESAQHGQVTLTDFLLQDAGDRWRRSCAVVAAALILVCFVFYIAAQFDAAGKAFSSYFHMSDSGAVVLGALIVLIYALAGGFWAVSITDSLQAVVMMIVALAVPAAAVHAAGGVQDALSLLEANAPDGFLDITGGHAPLMFAGFVLGTVGMSLGALGQPHLLARLMAVRGEAARRQGFVIAIGWGVVVFIGMVVLGLAGRALLPNLPSGEALFYVVAAEHLPAMLAGIVIAAALSAVMSTVDSILLAASAAVAHDMGVNARFRGRELLASRMVMCVLTALALWMTLALPDTIFNRVLFAWSALGAAFGPIVLWRVTGRTVSAHAALMSMLLGFGTTVLFYSYGASPPAADWLSLAAHLPGDPFERVVPWLPCLALLASRINRQLA